MADDAGAGGVGFESGWGFMIRNFDGVDEEEDGRGGEADGGEADRAGPEAAPGREVVRARKVGRAEGSDERFNSVSCITEV